MTLIEGVVLGRDGVLLRTLGSACLQDGRLHVVALLCYKLLQLRDLFLHMLKTSPIDLSLSFILGHRVCWGRCWDCEINPLDLKPLFHEKE